MGWVGRYGIPLRESDDAAGQVWVCPQSGERYRESAAECLEPCLPDESADTGSPRESPPVAGDHHGNGARVSAEPGALPAVLMTDFKSHFRPVEHAVRAAIDRVLASQRFILGEEVEAFESEMAAYTGARYAVSCASGSDALLLAALALDLRRATRC